MPSRRETLAALGTAVAGAVAGCGGRAPDDRSSGTAGAVRMDPEDRTGWRRPANDPANRRFAPGATPPRTTPSRRWRVPVDHLAGGPPVLEDGRLCYPEFFSVRGIDAATGEVEWRYKTSEEDPFAAINYGVCLVDGLVGFTDNAGHYHAVEAETGDQRWRFTLPEDDMFITWPTVARERVSYVGSRRGRLYAIDFPTGDVVWSRRVFGGIEHAVAVAGSAVVVPTTAGVARYDERGRGQWRTQLPATPAAEPTVAHGRVYVPCADEYLYALGIETGERLWRTRLLPERIHGSFYDPGIAVDAEWVYASTAYSLHRLAPESGEKRWGFTLDDMRSLDTPAAVANGTVYVGGEPALFGLKPGAGLGLGTLRYEPARWRIGFGVHTGALAVAGNRLYAPVADEEGHAISCFERA